MYGHFTLCSMVLVMMFGTQVLADCPGSWVKHGSKCYSFSQANMNWNDADTNCQATSSKLAEPRTTSESTFLIQQAQSHEANFWLGIKFLEGRWVYASDTTSVIVTAWAPGQPVPGTNNKGVCSWEDYNSKWANKPLTVSQKFICERPVTGK